MIQVWCVVCGILGEVQNTDESVEMIKSHFEEKHRDPITGKASGTIVDHGNGRTWRIGD